MRTQDTGSLSIELATITMNGDPDTGIKMKPGDRLWVQVRVPGEE